MIRWLAMSIVTLTAVAVASDSASPTPTTQPGMAAGHGQVFNFAKQYGQVEQQLREMELQLGRLRLLPQFRFDGQAMPFVNIKPFNIKPNNIDIYNVKPYGRPFRFNGLTVYVEPIAEAATGPITPMKK
ncbi:MAG: hypothetical protein ABSH08_11820 [Tepidisphaeraceae bacterium]|jgi:hypothetical protein